MPMPQTFDLGCLNLLNEQNSKRPSRYDQPPGTAVRLDTIAAAKYQVRRPKTYDTRLVLFGILKVAKNTACRS
jgi:hypothetical protein